MTFLRVKFAKLMNGIEVKLGQTTHEARLKNAEDNRNPNSKKKTPQLQIVKANGANEGK